MAGSEEVVELFSLTINDGDVVSKVDAILEAIQKLGVSTDEAMKAVSDAFDAGLLSLDEFAQAWFKLTLASEESVQQVVAAAEEIGQAEQQMAEEATAATEQMATSIEDAMATVQAAYDNGQISFQAYEEQMLAVVRGQEDAAASTGPEIEALGAEALALQAAGQAAGDYALMLSNLSGALEAALAGTTVLDDMDAAAQQFIETIDAVSRALDAETLALQEAGGAAADYISMLDSLGGAGEAATAGMFSLDQAIGDATTTYNELDDASATAAYDVQAVGNEAETAGEKVSGANEGFGASQYILFQLGFMAFSAAQQFFTLGVNAQDALTIIQGKTGASDQQMQQWTDTLEQMGLKGGYSLDVMAQGLDIVTQAQFKGADATTVLQYAMELARASGSKLTDSTNLLAMSMDAFGAKASDAHTYAAILFDALSNGKQNIQELTSALGPVVGEAAQAGISFEDLVTAETNFSHSTSNSMEATREFQSMIMAVAGDTQLTADQLAKLGLTFDQTKFQTLDFAGKLEFLAKYTDGNVQEFTQLIGGMKDAKDAMDTLDISTHQLAVNAENLGLSFDPVRYNAMDAADKLYYLLQVSGNNEAEFKKLTTGGVNPLSDALLQLSLSTNDVADRAKQMGLNFDESKFKTDDLTQKLWDLWDASGHNIDKFGTLIGGSHNVGAAFDAMGLKADGTSKKQDNLGQHTDDLGNKHLSALQQHLVDLNSDLDKNAGKVQTTTDKVQHLDDAYSKTATDLQANSGKFNAGLSDFAKSFAELVGPSLGDALKGLGSAFEWLSHNMGILQGLNQGNLQQNQLLVGSLTAVANALIAAAKWVWNLGVTVGNFVNSVPQLFVQLWNSIKQAFTSGTQSVEDDIQHFIDWILSKFNFLHIQLVGASIIPDMIDAITSVFRNAGSSWESAIQGDINGILSKFTSLPGQLYTSAVHAVQQFVAGLLSQIGNVENAASQIAAKVAAFLHHSTPDVGPMAGDDRWGPDFVELLATGMEANIGRLQQAASTVARSMAINPNLLTASSPLGSQQSITPIVTLLTQILSVLQAQRGGQGGSGVPPSVTMNNVFAGGGTSSVGQLYSQLDQLAGIRFEAGLRGAL